MRRGVIFGFLALMAGLAGCVLYYLKYEVQALEERLVQLDHEILQHQNALRVLRAEWSLLNQPDRLQRLARQHLNLVPVDGHQVASIAELPFHDTRRAVRENPVTDPTLPPRFVPRPRKRLGPAVPRRRVPAAAPGRFALAATWPNHRAPDHRVSDHRVSAASSYYYRRP